MTDFRPNDVLQMKVNNHFLDPAKPIFATVTFKTGADASAASAPCRNPANLITLETATGAQSDRE